VRNLLLFIFALIGLGSLAVAQDVPPGQAVPAEAQAQDAEDDGGRIVGGTPALEGSAPWQVEIYTTIAFTPAELAADRALGDDSPKKQFLDAKAKESPWELSHHCGGVLIGENWVLTAAHCFVDKTNKLRLLKDRRVRIGTQDLRYGTTYRVERVAVHAGYDRTGDKRNDIALFRIAPDNRSVKKIAARALPIRLLGTKPGDRALSPMDRVSVTGWGLTGVREGGSSTRDISGKPLRGSPVLLQVGLSVYSEAKCSAVAAYRASLGKGVICAGSPVAGKDSCNGDSGGPLTRAQGRERVLVGLVSWGKGCGLAGVPGLYTNVTDHLDWIEKAKKTAPAEAVTRI
jgi:secreted trypsin-like serine protease